MVSRSRVKRLFRLYVHLVHPRVDGAAWPPLKTVRSLVAFNLGAVSLGSKEMNLSCFSISAGPLNAARSLWWCSVTGYYVFRTAMSHPGSKPRDTSSWRSSGSGPDPRLIIVKNFKAAFSQILPHNVPWELNIWRVFGIKAWVQHNCPLRNLLRSWQRFHIDSVRVAWHLIQALEIFPCSTSGIFHIRYLYFLPS